ncbi:MAG: hypothetical protein J6R89_04430, partial [Clostridia bacterium]|nr:hypothetical protein [Clostridia bacterium]
MFVSSVSVGGAERTGEASKNATTARVCRRGFARLSFRAILSGTTACVSHDGFLSCIIFKIERFLHLSIARFFDSVNRTTRNFHEVHEVSRSFSIAL